MVILIDYFISWYVLLKYIRSQKTFRLFFSSVKKKKKTNATVSMCASVLFSRCRDGSGIHGFLETKRKSQHCLCYDGNSRLHVMFHMTAIIYCNRKILLAFVETRQIRLLCKKIKDGLKALSILMHLQVLGLFSKFFTGSRMQILYVCEGAQ